MLDLTSGNYGNSYLKLLHLFEVCHSCKTRKLFGVLFLSAFEKHLKLDVNVLAKYCTCMYITNNKYILIFFYDFKTCG